MDQYLASRGKARGKEIGNPKLGSKLGFSVFPQVCIIIVFLDIARYCGLGRCLASGGAGASGGGVIWPGLGSIRPKSFCYIC